MINNSALLSNNNHYDAATVSAFNLSHFSKEETDENHIVLFRD